MEGENIVYFSENGLERGVIQSKRNITRRQKYPANKMRAYLLVSYVIDGEISLNYLGGLLFRIFQIYPLKNLMMDTQLSVGLG